MGPRLVLRGELLRRDNVDKGWGKRGLFACRYIPRDSLTGIITPVRKYLSGNDPETFRRALGVPGKEGPNPMMYVLFAALAGVIAAFFIYRKKKAEE